MPARVRFGAFEFDRESGELYLVKNGKTAVERLSPQPARLLALLIDKRPALVTREQIREALWPEVQVEFEQSLHFCVRQIRAALGDSANESRYIETVPRRGYRLIAEDEPRLISKPRRRRLVLRAVAVIGAMLSVTLAIVQVRDSRMASTAPPHVSRVAVMPFESIRPLTASSSENDIAERILTLLTNDAQIAMELIGPTTTAAYDGRPQRLRELVRDYSIDYVVNGRQSSNESGEQFLAEIIRASDGVHVWVKWLDNYPSDPQIPQLIADGVLASLKDP